MWVRTPGMPWKVLTTWREPVLKGNWYFLRTHVSEPTGSTGEKEEYWITKPWVVPSILVSHPFLPIVQQPQKQEPARGACMSCFWMRRQMARPCPEAGGCCGTFCHSHTAQAPAACTVSTSWRAAPPARSPPSPPAGWLEVPASTPMRWGTTTSLRRAHLQNWRAGCCGRPSAPWRRTVTWIVLPPPLKRAPAFLLCPHQGMPAGWFAENHHPGHLCSP